MKTGDATPALVLSRVRYGDNSHVMRSFTRANGLQAFMVHHSRSGKGPFKPSMLLPLTYLDLVQDPRAKGDLGRILDARPARIWQSLHTDPVKMTLCAFFAEMLGRVVTGHHPDKVFFDNIIEFLRALDADERNMARAPHEFLLMVAQHLGCHPRAESYAEGSCFDMIEGSFTRTLPPHSYVMNERESQALYFLVTGSDQTIAKALRQKVLEELLKFLRIHHEPLGTLKSLAVVRDVLR